MCPFLLSTGDAAYLPRVKANFDAMARNVQGIGEHTWNNGYNGIAAAEYYLRTGDASVLPIIQYICDDAKHRQKFGRGWTHWSNEISPRYVASGLMNAAGVQMLTTLLLGLECGVDVDEETLTGALRYFYRFAGRGAVSYGDHRGEGGLGSNGKDGMVAAAMQIAVGAQGDVTICEDARRYLAMSMIESYPLLVFGHGDAGRGDGIWRPSFSRRQAKMIFFFYHPSPTTSATRGCRRPSRSWRSPCANACRNLSQVSTMIIRWRELLRRTDISRAEGFRLVS